MSCSRMRLVALAVVCGLIVGQGAGAGGAALPGHDSAQRMRATGSVLAALKRTEAELAEEPSLCFALRENEAQRQLLCNDRRSRFNYNPLTLRFGKRVAHGRASTRARTNNVSPGSLFPRELEVPT